MPELYWLPGIKIYSICFMSLIVVQAVVPEEEKNVLEQLKPPLPHHHTNQENIILITPQ